MPRHGHALQQNISLPLRRFSLCGTAMNFILFYFFERDGTALYFSFIEQWILIQRVVVVLELFTCIFTEFITST